jgi:hypothetical protein
MAKTKTTGFYFKATPEEMEWIEKRMEQAGCSNKSAYLRKIAIDGHVINFDLPALNEIGKLLRVTANNVNQIARRVNSGGEAYRGDVAEVNARLAEIRKDFGKLLTSLSELTDPKPGKRFLKPLTWRDLPGYDPLTGDMGLTDGAAMTEGA